MNRTPLDHLLPLRSCLVQAIAASAIILSIVMFQISDASAAVTWSFRNANPADTPVSGFMTFAVGSSAPGTNWDLSDIVDYSFRYDGLEIASREDPNDTTFFADMAGIPIFRFTQSTPFLPFVETEIGNFRSLLTNTTLNRPPRIFLVEGSDTGQTYMFCTPNLIPSPPVCNSKDSDLVALQWSVTGVPEPATFMFLLGGGFASVLIGCRARRGAAVVGRT